ncbi:hypothetical protein BX070DRAFT_254146 [Coemansia spiralis]|nr:hypothetical protein BX070DRAFT_254146 [Coemansia spiralis]
MPLDELFYAYYPDAPRRLLFREKYTGSLVPSNSQLSRLNKNGHVTVRVQMPHRIPRARWSLQDRPFSSFQSNQLAPLNFEPAFSGMHGSQQNQSCQLDGGLNLVQTTQSFSNTPYRTNTHTQHPSVASISNLLQPLESETYSNHRYQLQRSLRVSLPHLNLQSALRSTSDHSSAGGSSPSKRFRFSSDADCEHLSAEDIDILEELRPRFKFPTPPIERSLVRANICSTCQQRLRRARLGRQQQQANSPAPRYGQRSAFFAETQADMDLKDVTQAKVEAFGANSSILGYSNISAVRSTLHHPPLLYHSSSFKETEALGLKPTISTTTCPIDAKYRSLSSDQNASTDFIGEMNFKQQNMNYQIHHSPMSWSRSANKGVHGKIYVESDGNSENSEEELDATRIDLGFSEDDMVENCEKPSLKSWNLQSTALMSLPPPIPAPLIQSAIQDCTPKNGVSISRFNRNMTLQIRNTRMEANIEFRDASDTVLFQESVSNDYPFEDIFYQYCPDAPRSLLFYLQGGLAISKRTTLSEIFDSFEATELPLLVWAKLPTPANPDHCPQWQAAS